MPSHPNPAHPTSYTIPYHITPTQPSHTPTWPHPTPPHPTPAFAPSVPHTPLMTLITKNGAIAQSRQILAWTSSGFKIPVTFTRVCERLTSCLEWNQNSDTLKMYQKKYFPEYKFDCIWMKSLKKFMEITHSNCQGNHCLGNDNVLSTMDWPTSMGLQSSHSPTGFLPCYAMNLCHCSFFILN